MLRVPHSAALLALTTCYDDDALDLALPVAIHTDRFHGLPLDPVDGDRYVWPAALGPRVLDPLDADIISPDVLAAARNAARADLVLPSSAIVHAARAAAARGDAPLSAITRHVPPDTKTRLANIDDVKLRSEATREALRGTRVNYLNRNDYAEDKGLSWAAEQELIKRGEAEARARAAASVAVDPDAGMTLLERVEASFTRAQQLPKHPTKPGCKVVEVLDLLPDTSLCFAPAAGSGFVWVDFTRIEDAALDADTAAHLGRLRDATTGPGMTAAAVAAAEKSLLEAARAARAETAKQSLLAWTFVKDRRARGGAGLAANVSSGTGIGGMGLYRPRTAAQTAAARAGVKRARASARMGDDDDDNGGDDDNDYEDEDDENVDEDAFDEDAAAARDATTRAGLSTDSDAGLEDDDDDDDDMEDDDESGSGAHARSSKRASKAEARLQAKRALLSTLGRVKNTPQEAARALAEVRALKAAGAAGAAAAAAADAALAADGTVVTEWVREFTRAPVADLERDDNIYLVFSAGAAAAAAGGDGATVSDDVAVDGDGIRRGVVRYGRMRQRVALRKRIANAQDPCDKIIKSRASHIVLKQQNRAVPVAEIEAQP